MVGETTGNQQPHIQKKRQARYPTEYLKKVPLNTYFNCFIVGYMENVTPPQK
jgi:hypothetical protein